ncbi:proton channel OtopLc [Penaeus vannamei]|uniref:proton channel OtopLc n=1 Tax=Penaeus vannamei TaxID=6689 RepID=UPI00387F6794
MDNTGYIHTEAEPETPCTQASNASTDSSHSPGSDTPSSDSPRFDSPNSDSFGSDFPSTTVEKPSITPYRKNAIQKPATPLMVVQNWDSISLNHPVALIHPTVVSDSHSIKASDFHQQISYSDDKVEDQEPTEPKMKREWFKYSASENISIMYAIFLVMLGIVIYTADMFLGRQSVLAESFNNFLIIVQVIWLMYIHIDARIYVNHISKKLEEAEGERKDTQTGSNAQLQDPIPLHYGFTSGRHGGSIYLKIGATIFCFGHMIHTGLNLAQKVLYLLDDDPYFLECTNIPDVLMSVLQPICAFYQLFFIFKYSNLIINRRYVLARFGLMHCIGSSLCYWIYTILQETLQSIFTDFHGNSSSPSAHSSDDSSAWSIKYGCERDSYLSDMINYTTPYLYPFSIEFYILMVGLWMFLRANIGKVERHTHIPSVKVIYEGDHSKSLTSNLVIFVDCHSSNRGLFAGLFMTVITVIAIILLFILSSYEGSDEIGRYVNGVTEVVLLGVMVVAAAAAYKLIHRLDVIKETATSVDDILVYVSLPCIFFYAFLRLVPSILYSDALFGTMAILQILQVIVQTVMIYDGMRRCSNSSELRHKKPGREVITFMVVLNVALWLLQTFEVKTVGSNSAMYLFYGKEMWTLLSHLTLPFALFYRFHSSGCLANMWLVVYEVDEVH